MSDASRAQGQGLLDIADHDDLRCTIRKRDSGRGEGAKNINDYDRSNCVLGAYQQAINSNIQTCHPTTESEQQSLLGVQSRMRRTLCASGAMLTNCPRPASCSMPGSAITV